MATAASPALQEKMSRNPGAIGMIVFGIALVVGVIYTIVSIARDMGTVQSTSIFPFLLLGVALLTALGFEFVNGFHDTANAVATVIYTHSLEPHIAVVWSGICNFAGVLVSSGAVAFGIISLLPVELILQVGSGAGIRDGVRAADRRDYLEHGHLVLGLARIQFSHDGRLDHRRGYREPVDEPEAGHERRGLGSGAEDRRKSADLSADRLLLRGNTPASLQGGDQRQTVV